VDENWGIVGNERAVRALAVAVRNGAAVQAYLFTGPEGTGRATAARRLAMALNCTDEEPPCGNCGQCRRIEAGIQADFRTVTIDTEGEGAARKSISVEQLRDVERLVALAPYEGRTRVVIIDPADLMSDQAQNAFLKTLEEPPPHAVFILITAREELLLETIRSRCTRVEFRLVPTSEIEKALLVGEVNPDRAALLARLAGGRPGWALSAAREAAFLERRAEVLAGARTLPDLALADRFDLAEKLSEAFKRERDPVLRRLDDWAGWWRDVLLTQSGAAEAIANLDESEPISAAAHEYSRRDVARFVQAIIETRGYLEENVQSRVALDALMLSVPE
jgi:DNA polymerase-3 subunit delta'